MKLYTFWRSQAAFRVRIALNLKGLTREDVYINLDRCDQFKPEYMAHNPQAVVPTLYDDNAKLFLCLLKISFNHN
jgi:glutathione S-transferase